ncbi:MAG: hypothetical protein EXS05_21185 [Planctomycetaceae bacterium]|nr:hypothetical protein [Planctomycetaceae bacterium]
MGRGRTYYWMMSDPDARHSIEPGTDVEGLAEGYITLTPLQFNLTDRRRLDEVAGYTWTLRQ